MVIDPISTLRRVVFEGVEVLGILQDGKEKENAYHCQMANGTTTFVPKELF